MAYADIVATAQERQEYQDMLRVLELLRKNQESELIGQEAAEYVALEARLEASGAFKRLLTQDASGQIVIRPEFLERISGGQAAPTETPTPTPTPRGGQPPTGDEFVGNVWGEPTPAQPLPDQLSPGDQRQELLDILTAKLNAGDTHEFPWTTYLKLLEKPEGQKTKGKYVKYFPMSGEDEEGNIIEWQLGVLEDGTTEVVPGTIKGAAQAKAKTGRSLYPVTFYDDETERQVTALVDMLTGDEVPRSRKPVGPKEPYSTALTPYQQSFMKWYRETQEEKYGEKTLADKIRLGLVVPETRGRKRGYYDIEKDEFIETGEAEPGPMKYLKSITRRTGKRSQYGDYEVEDVDLMQDPTTGRITESVRGSPHWEEGEAGRVEAGYAPAAWAGQQAYGQKVAAALAPQNTSAYLGGSIQEALKLWPILGLPQQATVMDMLKQQGVSFPGQPKYISSPGATGTAATIKAPEFPLETIQNKPPSWLQATSLWR